MRIAKKIVLSLMAAMALSCSLVLCGCTTDISQKTSETGETREMETAETTVTASLTSSMEETAEGPSDGPDVGWDDPIDTTDVTTEPSLEEFFTGTTGETTETTSDGGFIGMAEETTTAAATEAPVETLPIETEPLVTEAVLAPEVPMGSPIANKYAYNTLTDREKKLYDSIYNAIINLQPTVDIETDGYTEDEWTKIFSDVCHQETDLFWVYPYLTPGEIEYRTTDPQEIEKMRAQIDNTVNAIISNASTLKTEVERVKYVHDCLITINDFEKGGGASYSPTIYGGLVLGSPQCEGYAKSFAHVCNRMGIETIIMTGNVASGASHAWNKVKINGKWYNIDLTNDDPILQTPNSKYIRYNYFLVPDSWIQDITHFRFNLSQMFSSVQLFPAPAATSSDYYYFNYFDRTYSDYESAYNELLTRVVKGVANKEALVQVRVSNLSVYTALKDSLMRLKDDAKAQTGGGWTRVAASTDDNLYIVGVALEF